PGDWSATGGRGAAVFYRLVRAIVAPILRIFWRPWVEGLENIPEQGGAILAGHHLAVVDSVFLPSFLPRRMTFIAKSDYFTERGVKGRLKSIFMRGVGFVPVDRTGGAASEAALQTGIRALDEGMLLCIYPEGTRSPDGRLYRGKVGV